MRTVFDIKRDLDPELYVNLVQKVQKERRALVPVEPVASAEPKQEVINSVDENLTLFADLVSGKRTRTATKRGRRSNVIPMPQYTASTRKKRRCN